MKCGKCGSELENNALICPFCGQAVPDEARIQEQYAGRQMTRKEFLELPAMKSCKSNINSCGIVLYVIVAINIVVQIVGGTYSFIDAVVLLLLGLGIHLGKSRVASILCLAYGAFNVLYLLYLTGRVTGWWILVIAIDAVIYTFRYHSAWGKYVKDGTLPVEKSR